MRTKLKQALLFPLWGLHSKNHGSYIHHERQPLDIAYYYHDFLRACLLEPNGLMGVSGKFKQITTAGATVAAVTEKVRGEYVSVVCDTLRIAKRNTTMSEFKISVFLVSHSQMEGESENRKTAQKYAKKQQTASDFFLNTETARTRRLTVWMLTW